jgi:hypothetical protein
MNRFDKLKIKNLDEFAVWLESIACDDSPWMKWFNDTYCTNCKPVLGFIDYLGRDCECSYCELNGNCRYFLDLPEVPSPEETVKLWLKADGAL